MGLSLIPTSDSRGWSEITLSAASERASRIRQSIIIRANLLDIQLRESGVPYWCAFVTLTYARQGGWSARHVTQFNKRMRDHLRRRGVACPYVWCAELQKRGAVHFHQLVFLPTGMMLPKPDRIGWWEHGMSKIERARNAVGYVAKYAGKVVEVGEFPRGLRLTGAGGLTDHSREHARYCRLPTYVRNAWPMGTRIERLPGGGWVNLDTGEVVVSDWKFVGRRPGGLITLRRGVRPADEGGGGA